MWSNPDLTKFPLYVRRSAIVPMLPDGVETLCDANYVNNAGIKTWDGSLVLRIYPEGTSEFTIYDGTKITCQIVAGWTTEVTVTSTPRSIVLQVLAPEPTQVKLDGTVLTKSPTESAFEGASSGWRVSPDPLRSSASFLFIKFPHPGGTTRVDF